MKELVGREEMWGAASLVDRAVVAEFTGRADRADLVDSDELMVEADGAAGMMVATCCLYSS